MRPDSHSGANARRRKNDKNSHKREVYKIMMRFLFHADPVVFSE
jgi:hypothetical protein